MLNCTEWCYGLAHLWRDYRNNAVDTLEKIELRHIHCHYVDTECWALMGVFPKHSLLLHYPKATIVSVIKYYFIFKW
jgi:hypothetical protein